jgi:hypothetical protein
MYPPVLKITAINMYSDAKSSVVDPDKAAQNARLQKDLGSFIDALASRLDTSLEREPDTAAIDCVKTNLANWANAGALMEPPVWSAEVAEQTKAVVALQFIFLKLDALGIQLPDHTQAWRRNTLSTMLKMKPNSNLMVWLGTAAATGDLVERNSDLRRFHDSVWVDATSAIAADGTIASELGRGQRAFIYHTFYYNALSALWTVRQALAIEAKPRETAALQRLGRLVGEASCGGLEFAQKTGVQQESLDRWNRSMAAAFASQFNTQDWLLCATIPDRFPGSGWGGRFDLTVRSIKTVGRK